MGEQRLSRDGNPWPSDVEPITLDKIDMLGVQRHTNELHWDGAPVITKHELGRREFLLAFVAAWATVAAAVIAALAFAFQVYAQYSAVTPPA